MARFMPILPFFWRMIQHMARMDAVLATQEQHLGLKLVVLRSPMNLFSEWKIGSSCMAQPEAISTDKASDKVLDRTYYHCWEGMVSRTPDNSRWSLIPIRTKFAKFGRNASYQYGQNGTKVPPKPNRWTWQKCRKIFRHDTNPDKYLISARRKFFGSYFQIQLFTAEM